jgi:DNA-binding NtrC family response regulator
VIEIYKLGEPIDLADWLKRLKPHEVSVWPENRAERAPWTGNPFIVAGNKASLKRWFDSLDPEGALKIIRDHAYFWVLTSTSGFEHDLIPRDRLTVLDWTKQEHNVIHEAMDMLTRLPRLAGLSKGMHHLREEIVRIGAGKQEPASPVLIFGETGSGKEGTAQSLFDECSRELKPGLYSMGGSLLEMDPGMALAELFGIDPGVASDVKGRPGLLEIFSEGGIFIDDFDTAPRMLQERLLRITSTPKGQKAVFRRIGGDEDIFTNVWLIFATNHDITQMLKSGALRLDFLFRFEDRVLVVPPLRSRPADVPAIARSLWNSLTAAAGEALEDRVLSWRSLRDLHSRKLEWKGNVRELAGLLSLVASMCKMPKQRHKSTDTLIKQVLAKGPGYFEWFGIVASEEFTAAPPAPDRVDQFLATDPDPAPGELSACEIEVRDRLGDSQWNEFLALVQEKVKRNQDEIRRIFCRYQVYALRFGATLSRDEAHRLSGREVTQALKHLKWLSESNRFLQPADRSSSSNAKWIYGPGTYYS